VSGFGRKDVSAKNVEKVLMYASTSWRWRSDNRDFQPGIAVPPRPSSMDRIRSASVGNCPLAVVRIW